MELLFVVLGGAILGLAARYALPRRHTYGVALVPAVGAGVAAVVWVALTWLGWAWDGGWIWWVSLGASVVVAAIVDLWLGRRRTEHDRQLLHTLTRTGVPARP
jgi:peptidoglycan/LPS O-acetylase OafA/YrhL